MKPPPSSFIIPYPATETVVMCGRILMDECPKVVNFDLENRLKTPWLATTKKPTGN